MQVQRISSIGVAMAVDKDSSNTKPHNVSRLAMT
jgi:hypothetical protein